MRAALLASPALIAAPSLAQSPSFQGLGTVGGYGSYLDQGGVSADGSTVVGYSYTVGDAAVRAFRYSGGVMQDLGTLGGTNSYGNGVSADGSVIVGYSQTAGDAAYHATRWAGGAITDLGTLGGDSYGTDVSADGSVVVGYSYTVGSVSHAFRWSGGVMSDLGTLGGTRSYAYGVSADGSVVIGSGDIAGNFSHAFRWTGGVMSDLGTLGGQRSYGNGVSADGNVVVGASQTTGNVAQHAFRWTGGVMSDLGALPGGTFSAAYAANTDGSVVVGYSNGTSGTQAIRWTATTNMQSVSDLLVAAGVNVAGWSLTSANGVSADGSVIVGNGNNGNAGGRDEVWIARLCDLGCASGGTGMITVSNQMQSFASVGQVGQTANASLGTNFSTVTNYATQSGAATAPGTTGSAFSAAGYDSDPTVSGTLGFTRKINDSGMIWGATFGADYIKTNMSDSGSSRMNAGTVGTFIANAPDAGWQWLVGANAIYLTGNISRGYLNGASAVTSTGSTRGTGYGVAGRFGYTFSNVWSNTSLTPFASYSFTRVDFKGYTETDGPFPAAMDGFRNVEQVSRLGADARYTLAPGKWLWGTLAWGHRLDRGNSADVSGTLIGLFPLSTSGGATTKRDWLETTAGIRYGAWKNGAITASLTAIVPENIPANFVASLGVTQAF